MEQLDLFGAIEALLQDDDEKAKSELWTSAWKLYTFLKANPGRKFTDRELLLAIPDYEYIEEHNEYPDRPYNNMTSVRNMRKDKEGIRRCSAIQKVLIEGKLPNTEEEALKSLDRRRNRLDTEEKLYWDDVKRLSLHNQMRLIEEHSRKRPYIEAILPMPQAQNQISQGAAQ